MRSRVNVRGFLFFAIIVLLAMFPFRCLAQAGSGMLSGTVTDPSGAVMSDATVNLIPSQGAAPITATTNQLGIFQFRGLPLGTYTLTATAKGFSVYVKENIEIRAGPAQKYSTFDSGREGANSS
jgi:Carboxypeptidase regulatory-like domain